MKKIISLLLILGLLLVPTSVGAESGIEVTYGEGDGEWVGNVWYVSLYPGEYKDTFMEVKNATSGSLDLKVLLSSCCLTCVSPRSFALGPGKTRKVYLVVSAPGDLAPGTYNVTWSIKTDKPSVPIYTPPVTPPTDEEPIDEEPVDEEPVDEDPVVEDPIEPEPVDDPDEEEYVRNTDRLLLLGVLIASLIIWGVILAERKKNKKKEMV